jgi:hypothetical protein
VLSALVYHTTPTRLFGIGTDVTRRAAIE